MDIKVVGKTCDSMWHFPLTSIMVTMDKEEYDHLNSSYARLIENVTNNFDCIKFVGEILEKFKDSEDND